MLAQFSTIQQYNTVVIQINYQFHNFTPYINEEANDDTFYYVFSEYLLKYTEMLTDTMYVFYNFMTIVQTHSRVVHSIW